MPDKKYTRWATSLIGGGDGALDSYDGTLLQDEEMALTNVLGDKFYTHILNATSGAVASPPEVIAPVLNAGLKRWILQSVHTKIDGIDLNGGTDIGAALADTDLILVDDGGAGTNRKATLSRLLTYMQDNLVISILLTLLATASSNVYAPTMITTSLTVTVS